MADDKKKKGPAFASRQALDSLSATVERLRSDLGRLGADTVTTTALESTTKRLSGELRQALTDASRADIQGRFASVEQELALLRETRQVQVDHLQGLLEQVRADVSIYHQQLAELDARTADERIRTAVEEQGAKRADDAFQRHIAPKLSELEDAYDEADDRLAQLKAYIDGFGPGGLPVLAQERDTLRQRVGELEAQLGGERTRADELLARVRELESSRLKRVLDDGVTPELLEARLAELQSQTAGLRERRALQSQNERLGAKVQQLETELATWGDNAKMAEVARAERAQVQRYERERDDAEGRREDAERRARAAEAAERMARGRETSALARLAEVEGAEQSAAERESRLEALSEELGQYRRELEESERRESDARAELERSRGELLALRADLEDAQDHLQVAESKWREAFAVEKQTEFAEAHQRYRSAAEAEARAMRLELEQQLTDARARDRASCEQLEALRLRLQTLEGELRTSQLVQMQATEMLRSTELRHQQELASLETSVADRKQQLDDEHGQRLERLRLEIEDERQRALGAAVQDKKILDADVARLSADRDGLYDEINEFTAQKGVLEAELEVLRSRLDELRTKDVPEEERLGKLHRAAFDELAPATEAHELDWLRSVEDGIRAAGFQFHPRLLRAFHTSLKIADHAPLAVLAGISGTGKSELPRLYSDLGGLPFLELAVQPSWDSPQDLFGFFNYTDGRLKAEPLARLLHQLGKPEDPLRDSPLIVLLDEMNLARVEYYFAALLSKLETRRGVDATNAADRVRASIRLDAGPGAAELLLFPDRRALFVGTMNEDESTLTLSDKVLDRACVLTFPAPEAMEDREQPERRRRATRLSWTSWTQWQQVERSPDLGDELNELNQAMRGVGRPFGHRLFRAIHAYVALYPHADPEVARNEALVDQWAMKVLPRLKGLECDDKRVRSGLEVLRTLVPDELEPAFQDARDREFFSFAGAAEVYRGDA